MEGIVKYIKFNYIDSSSGVPETEQPISNAKALPAILGLELLWESVISPDLHVSFLYGTCSDAAELPYYAFEITKEQFDLLHAADQKSRVPKSVLIKQAKLALHAFGYFTTVDGYIQSSTDMNLKIIWEHAMRIERYDPLVLGIAQMLQMTDEQLDMLFIAASKIE